MPIHVSNCVKCVADFETLTLSMRAEVDRTCPACGALGEARFGVPLLKTNSSFMKGAKFGMEQFASAHPNIRKRIAREAAKAGVSVNGKIYQGQAARFPGDPRAWISHQDDLRKLAEEDGAEVPMFGIKGRDVEPKPPAPVPEDLIDKRVEKLVEAGKVERHKARSEEVREAVAVSLLPKHKQSGYKAPKSTNRSK